MDRESGTATGTGALLLWMPGLFGTGRTPTALERALPSIARLWPGLPARLASPSHVPSWTPRGLPCPESDMGAFVAELERFAEDALRGGQAVRDVLVARAREEARAGEERELEALRSLGGGAVSGGASRLRRRAQRLLAWHWFQQRTLAEMEGLAERVARGEGSLGLAFLEGDEEAPQPQEGRIGNAEPLPSFSWRPLLWAAGLLAPEEAVFVWEGRPEGLEGLEERPPFAEGLELPPGIAAEGRELDLDGLEPASAKGLGREGTGRRLRLLCLGEGA